MWDFSLKSRGLAINKKKPDKSHSLEPFYRTVTLQSTGVMTSATLNYTLQTFSKSLIQHLENIYKALFMYIFLSRVMLIPVLGVASYFCN